METKFDITIFGAGGLAERVIDRISKAHKITHVVDNDKNKWGSLFKGHIIKDPNSVLQRDNVNMKIIIASSFYKEISYQLNQLGYKENVNYFSYELSIDNIYCLAKVSSKIQKAEIVLDIGCGIRPQQFIKPKVHICCDPFPEYIKTLQSRVAGMNSNTSYIFLNSSFDKVLEVFPPKSVDTIFLLDVIEHIEKEEVVRLLKISESLARKQIIIFTPYGFMPQVHSDGVDGWGMNGGKWQEHKSGWIVEDFDSSWEIIIDKERHQVNSKGEKFEEPFSAIWAIKNICN